MHHRGSRSLLAQLLFADGSKAQRIHHRERSGAHGKDVAKDAPNAGSRALERLDKRGMVMRLDFERAGPAVADVDNPGILSRPLHHAFAMRWQPLEVDP